MKNKFSVLGMLTLVIAFGFPQQTFAQSPLSGSKLLEHYEERESYAIVNGIRTHYWLYRAINGQNYIAADPMDLYDSFITYAERLGWTRDYTKEMQGSHPNRQLAESVKAMMDSHRAIVSMTIIENGPKSAVLVVNGRFWPDGRSPYGSGGEFASDFYTLVK